MRRKILSAFLCALAAAMLFSGCGGSRLRFGTSGEGGTYGEIAAAIAENTENLRFNIRETAGSAANVRLLSEGYLDFAIAQADVVSDAYGGVGTFAGSKSYQGYAAVAGLYTEACQIIVRADSDIKMIEDLESKTVSIGEAESGTEQNAVQILSVYGLNKSCVNEVNLNYEDASDQLGSGKIDAFFCTLAPNSPFLKELAKDGGIRLLSLSENAVRRLVDAYGFYTEYTIQKGTYPNQTEDVRTVGMKALLLASEKTDPEIVRTVTETLFEKREEIDSATSAELNLDIESAVAGAPIPFHKGAAEYYKSLGVSAE